MNFCHRKLTPFFIRSKASKQNVCRQELTLGVFSRKTFSIPIASDDGRLKQAAADEGRLYTPFAITYLKNSNKLKVGIGISKFPVFIVLTEVITFLTTARLKV